MNVSPEGRGSAWERILEAAVTLFADRGFAAVSINDIAAETGTSTGLIYYHFKDKQELLQTAVEDAAAMLQSGAVASFGTEGTAKERILAFVRTYSGLLGNAPDMMRLLVRVMSDIQGPLPATLLARTSAVIELLAGLVAEGVESGEFREIDPLHAAAALFAMINTPITARAIGAPLIDRIDADPESVASFMTDLFFKGVESC